MSKYNAKAEGVKPTVVNAMGENAYQLSAKEELVSTCMTTFLSGDHYYETEKEVVNRIVSKLNEVDPLFAAKLALYVRNEGNLRSVSHLIAATIAKRASGTEWSKRFYNQTITSKEFAELKEKVLNAIEDALQISCQNIPELDGNSTAILIDHSGSVRGDEGGSSRVSAFSKTTTAMIGNLFGSMMAYRQKNVYIGLFGDRLIPVKIDRSKKLLDFNKYSFNEGAKCGGSTEQGIYDFFRQAVSEKKKIDNIIVFSDCQIGSSGSTSWYGTSGTERSATFQDLIKQFRNINPLCNIIVVDIHNTRGNNVFYKPERVLNIAGWSANIFDVIKSNTKGFGAILKEIEAIEI